MFIHVVESDDLQKIYLQELERKQPHLTRPRGIRRKVDLKQLLLPGSSGSNLDAIQQPENKSLLKMKLLQFTENVRPAYYGNDQKSISTYMYTCWQFGMISTWLGTWTKPNGTITPKNPFTKDANLVDYDYDSEAEWEPEGEGEDIQSGDEDEDEVAPEPIDPEDVSRGIWKQG